MEKSYEVRLSPAAGKFLEWLAGRDFELFVRLRRALKRLEIDPHAGKPLVGEGRGLFSLRIGSYRVIYELIKGQLVVHIIDIGHRREIYSKLN